MKCIMLLRYLDVALCSGAFLFFSSHFFVVTVQSVQNAKSMVDGIL